MNYSRFGFTVRLALYYLIFISIWFFFSDPIVKSVLNAPQALTTFQLYKNWIFVFINLSLLLIWHRWDFARRKVEQGEKESKLRASEEQYRQLFEGSLDVILLTAPDGSILAANPAACRIFGYSEAEICSAGRNRLLDTSDPRLPLALEERNRTGRFLGELTFIRSDGSKFPGEISSAIFQNSDGQDRTCMIIRDISERKRSESALRASLEFKEAVYTAIHDGISVIDLQGVHLDVNDALCQMTGFSREELIHTGPPHPYWAEEAMDKIEQALEKTVQNCGEEYELTFKRKSGERFPVIVSPTPIRDGAGKVIAYCAMLKDISEHKQAELELQKQKELLQTIFDSIPVFICVIDPQGKVKMVNSPLQTSLGWSQAEWEHENILPRCYPDEAVLQRAYADIERADRSWADYKTYTKTGTILSTMWANIRLNDGTTVGIGQDITERKQAEEAVSNSKFLLQQVIDGLDAFTYVVDINGSFLLANKKLAMLFGQPVHAIPGKPREAFMPQENARQHGENDLQVIQTGETIAFDETNQELDGRHAYYSLKFPLRDGQGKIYAVGGISTDVTERNRTLEALRISEERYRSLIEQASDGIFVSDPDGNYVDVNNSGCALLGYTRDEILQRNMRDLVSLQELTQQPFRLADLRAGKMVLSERKMIRKDGSLVQVEISAKMLADGRMQGIVRDITDRKRVEAELAQSHADLRQVSARLAEVQEAERLALSKDLHDRVGQSLSALGINLNIIRNRLDTDTPEKLAQRFSSTFALVSEITEQVRNVMTELHPSILDDYGLAAALRGYSDNLHKHTNLEVEINGDIDLQPVTNMTLFRIAQEALTNVVKHSGTARANISLQELPDKALMVISDQGRGFQPGAPGSESHVHWGMLTMRERAESIGGSLQVESAPGLGTKVSITIPR